MSPQTEARILDTAEHLFAAQPFNEVHFERIAAEAKISKVTLYRYFRNKDELYLRLLERIGRDYLLRMRETERSVQGCRARLVSVTEAALNYFNERPHLLRLLDRAGIDQGRGQGFPWLEVQQEFFRILQGLFAEGSVRGEFEVEDLELAVRGLLGTLRFQFLYPCEHGDNEKIPERIVGMLIRQNRSSSSGRAA
jgi:AcrR family transcriptional regulator